MLDMHTTEDLVSPRMQAMIVIHHSPILSSKQCGSSLVKTIYSPLPLVWSLITRFEHPQCYKQFVKECTMVAGDGSIGSVREVTVKSGLPANVSVESLDYLNDDKHIMKVSIIGGDQRLVNYCSTITLHEEEDSYGMKTVAIESYVVDIPAGNSAEDTCYFTNNIIRCNHRSLAKITEDMVRKA